MYSTTKGIKTILGNNFFIYIDNTEIFTNVSKERVTVPLWLKAHANGDRSRRVVTSRTASCSSNYRRQVWAHTYGIKEYLYCYLIHFCNIIMDNNRSVSFGFIRFHSVLWKRATLCIPSVFVACWSSASAAAINYDNIITISMTCAPHPLAWFEALFSICDTRNFNFGLQLHSVNYLVPVLLP